MIRCESMLHLLRDPILRLLYCCIALWIAWWPVVGGADEPVIKGDGERQWRLLPYGDGQIKRLEVSGPVYVNLVRDPGSPPCSQARVRVDQNLSSLLEISQANDVLRINLAWGAIPSDWVEVRIFCTSVEQVTATHHAVVIMRARDLDRLSLHADNALISVVGEARRLDAVVENHSVLGVLDLKAEEGGLKVLGSSMAKLRRNNRLTLESEAGSKVYVLDQDQPININTEISPGVLLVPLHVYIHDYAEVYYAKKSFNQVIPLILINNEAGYPGYDAGLSLNAQVFTDEIFDQEIPAQPSVDAALSFECSLVPEAEDFKLHLLSLPFADACTLLNSCVQEQMQRRLGIQ